MLAQAYEEFAKGDFVQASEKGWGATAQIVKAIAQERGWPHDSHAELATLFLYQIVNELRHETGDAELAIPIQRLWHKWSTTCFRTLFVNFYENATTRAITYEEFAKGISSTSEKGWGARAQGFVEQGRGTSLFRRNAASLRRGSSKTLPPIADEIAFEPKATLSRWHETNTTC